VTILHFLCWSKSPTVALLQRVVSIGTQPGHHDTQHSCMELKDAYGRCVLHFAAQRGNIELINYLLTLPAAKSLAAADWRGRSLLHYATESSRVHAIDLFIQEGFDIDAKDNSGRTLLHHAAMKDHVAAFARLLDLGASHHLTSVDCSNRTPYQTALLYHSEDVLLYIRSNASLRQLGLPPENQELESLSSDQLSAPKAWISRMPPCDCEDTKRVCMWVCWIAILSMFWLRVLA
jgi:ankyrin repeat protein